MPADDYLDKLAALMGAEDLDRYIALRQQRTEFLTIDAEVSAGLMELARTYGVPGLDGIQSASNADLRNRHRAHGYNLTNWWAATPSSWQCPCCMRDKARLVRRDKDGRLLGRLTAHHDHFVDYLDNIVAERAKIIGVKALDDGGRRFVQRFRGAFARFDDVIVCEDCNNADARAKRLVEAPEYLTFSPQEIAGFIVVKPNAVHDLDPARATAIYVAARKHYDTRLRSAENLADRVLRGEQWFEHHDFDHQSDTIDRRAGDALRMFGLNAGSLASPIVTELLLEIRLERTGHNTWRTRRRRPAAQSPTANEIAYVAASQKERWTLVPDDWLCPACQRTKVEIIRPSNQFKWLFLLEESGSWTAQS